MKGQTYIILALIFALIVAVFAVINVEPVEVDYLFGTGEAPLILVILISVLMGGLITAAFGTFHLLKLQRQIRTLEREKSSAKADETIAVESESEEVSVDSEKNSDLPKE
ncbi:hypothetical protein GCM10011351_16110 [Paraliobacillus quinghaiensis]|uniref:Lipopolysaccharide assembly protein A domain-containing protein n=1 Tax=Paraliobacillus quinghaiensis TaxID=470815 RepID=A0A917TP45_9BACI|nr:lipopolysaccharide assembly protein LapA domain-containing protein [Paraliobacillus quinghaiensis]GGM30764.1 hypothetical protein GCM10011351_16110 [Paraliobacillus quinghaiensis]